MNRIGKRIIGTMALLLGALTAAAASADEYAESWGPVLGSPMPLLSAPDQTGTARTLEDLSGDQGLLLFLSRSADW